MKNKLIKFSVCIPAYNRSSVLGDLLDSILMQTYNNFEVVINEDHSPERDLIRKIVSDYSLKYPNKIKYHENKTNLGYDANLRSLIELSEGDYCVFMGNDDLMCPNALSIIYETIKESPNVGVFLRSFSAFDDTPNNVVQIFRYFDGVRFFPAGAQTISTFYKRCVVIPGVTFSREAALKYATEKFDGTLLYQIYLIANILVDYNGVYSPEIITLYRNGGVPDFGSSPSEKGKFVPHVRTIESSIGFMAGMLQIAKYVEETRNVSIYKNILNDLSNYAYPILSVQAKRPIREFFGYYKSLIKLGMGCSVAFHIYFISLVIFGPSFMDKIISIIKKAVGFTPAIGKVYKGSKS